MVESLKTGDHPKIFISHASDEQILADAWKELIEAVSAKGIKAWFSSDKNPSGGMPLGNQWFEKIYQQIRESELVLAIQTPASAGRPWIMWECGIASGMDKHNNIITIIYDMEPGDLTMPLTSYQIYQGNDETSVLEVCKRLLYEHGLAAPNYTYEGATKQYFESIKLHIPPQDVSRAIPYKGTNVKPSFKKISTEQIDLWYKRFDDYVQAGRISELNILRQLMYVSLGKPVDLAIHSMLGQQLLNQKDFRAALEEIDYALEFAPHDTVLLYLKALTLVELLDFTSAEKVIDTVVSMDTDLGKNAEIASLQGRIYRERWRETKDLVDLEKAFQAYYTAFQVDKMAYFPGINAAALAFIKGEEGFAIGIVQDVLEICQQLQSQPPVSYWVDFSAGEAYLGLGEIDKALAEYEKGLRRKPAPGPRELSSALGGISRMADAKKLSNEVIDNFVVKIKTLFKLP